MKRALAILVVAAFLAGCAPTLPPAVKGALYSAQTTLEITVEEAAAGDRGVWKIPDGATTEEKLACRERQVIECTKTMAQANENLKAVVAWFRNDEAVGGGK